MSSRPGSRALPWKSSSASNNRPSPNTSESTGPYNRNFQQHLVDNSIYHEGYEYPDGRIPPMPNNWEEVNHRLSEPRPSLCPSRFSETDFKKFKRADRYAFKEKQVSTSVIPIIEGNFGAPNCVSGGIPFTNLDHLTDGTAVSGNPDLYYGARPEQLNPRVRDELSGHIIPSTQHNLPLAPNFFVAVKGPNGTFPVVDNQANYDGALGARGMHSLQSYGQEEHVFDNNASTISSIYHGGLLKMFTIHPSRPTDPSNRPEYYMHQLNAWAMTGNAETFRQGSTAYRNARDWAKEQRDEAIRRANERVPGHTKT